MHIDDVVAELDGHPFEVERCCTRLFREGHLTTTSCGVYRLSSRGLRRCRSDDADADADADADVASGD
ncbi:hypothetical protein [Halorussus sp. GCM10023401]|uniref:hypothetical protein n=1 Tax=Halorussus sp. GCM10023401 TaxID=3252680 RepID=UPI0036097B9C